ncbi:four helix bundle protein [Fluviicola sp.]|uniref:four helix bundle protein n=1 Tax=Fluviicola sp. TaxID=1917219 RepID=UPI0031DF9531
MEISSYRDLIVWQKGIELAVNVYSLTKNFPDDEKFALSNQVKRCVTSIPANIAEGYGRQSSKSYSQFMKISRGSLFELETHLLLAEKLGFIQNNELYAHVKEQITEEGKMLNAFIKKLDDK